eukprot:scaffold8761_cov97-Isochrysis_galbana.AAC.2
MARRLHGFRLFPSPSASRTSHRPASWSKESVNPSAPLSSGRAVSPTSRTACPPTSGSCSAQRELARSKARVSAASRPVSTVDQPMELPPVTTQQATELALHGPP